MCDSCSNSVPDGPSDSGSQEEFDYPSESEEENSNDAADS
ncbi:hypothetical protein A2U01_0065546, partial [Trifolium medium]|nr:hypothetical protein [Trifolium medium]